MHFHRLVGCFCGLLIAAGTTQPSWSAEATTPSASLVAHLPSGAVATLELANLAPLIERIETSTALRSLIDSPQWQQALQQDQVQKGLAGKALAEGQLGMSLWQFAKTYLGDRSVLGIYPPSQPGGGPEGVLIVQVKEAAALTTLLDRLRPLLPLAGNQLKIADFAGGGQLMTVADGHQIVIRDRWVVVTKVPALLNQTLQSFTIVAGTEPATGLLDVPAWKQMTAQLGSDHQVQFCLNMTRLNEIAGHRFIPARLDNGLISLLFGGYLELAANSPYLGSTLDIGANTFEWRTAVAGDSQHLDAAHQPFVPDVESVPQAAIPTLDNALNGFSLTRDFAGWYRNREKLLDAKLLPGFDKFETGLATFLPGRDFAEDVLPTLGQRLTIVTAPQSFAHLKGKPGVQLPGLAIILDPAKPAEAKDLVSLFFQTVILIGNFQASQEGRQPFVLSSESWHDVQIAFAKYLKPPEGETLPISFNFQPASARVGNRFIISTNVEMCRQHRSMVCRMSPRRECATFFWISRRRLSPTCSHSMPRSCMRKACNRGNPLISPLKNSTRC
jgi:hypothetical protein